MCTDHSIHVRVGSRSVRDMMDEGVRNLYNRLIRGISSGKIKPDSGTLEDISWIEEYCDFGRFITTYKPTLERCSNCRQLRLGFTNLMTREFKCFKCGIAEKVFWAATNGDYDKPIVKKYLNEGVVDPTVEWTSYQQMLDEEARRIQEWQELSKNNPLAAYSPSTKEELAKKFYQGINSGVV